MKAENERMKSENRALTRVVSKLTANAAAAKAQARDERAGPGAGVPPPAAAAKAQAQAQQQHQQQQQSPPWTLVSGRPLEGFAADFPQWAKIRKNVQLRE